jgi:hypothetical protein
LLSAAFKNQSLFLYTAGRFFFNENHRMQERHVEFNVEALQHAAKASVSNEHGKVISIAKTLEVSFGSMAKVPYHIAVLKYFATASEAATLTFLRSKDIPVPEIYGYCANAENPVGTE